MSHVSSSSEMTMTTTGSHSSPFSYLTSGAVIKRNLLIALVVGIILSAANQFDVILNQPWTLRLGIKILFNFLVPFIVASVSAWCNRPNSQKDENS